ncbi:uncharacterized protein LOC120342433 [Styela clava]|uniref:uncharacterized protein LOC120342433 n=1 Tax=Styela clava TaxID=7725 RepID=UPI00193A5416|nr:uncharacterized protein LOC120342433 [Styela clava]
MDITIFIRIIIIAITFTFVTSSPVLQHKSSGMPHLLRRLLHSYNTMPKSGEVSPEYYVSPPNVMRRYRNYDWQYYDGRRQHKRQSGLTPSRSGKRTVICAKNKRGRCVAKCGFGAPLDQISKNMFFGCRPTLTFRHQRI